MQSLIMDEQISFFYFRTQNSPTTISIELSITYFSDLLFSSPAQILISSPRSQNYLQMLVMCNTAWG